MGADIFAYLVFGIDMGREPEKYLPGLSYSGNDFGSYPNIQDYFPEDSILQIQSYVSENDQHYLLHMNGSLKTYELRYHGNALPVFIKDVPPSEIIQARLFAEQRGIKWKHPKWLLCAEILGD